MKRTILSILSALILAGFGFAGCSEESAIAPTSSNTGSDAKGAGAYIVVMKDSEGGSLQSASSAESQVQSMINTHGIAMSSVSQVYTNALKGFAAQLTADQVAGLQNDKSVAYLEKDQLVKIDDIETPVVDQSGSKNSIQSQTVPWGIAYVGGAISYTGTNQAWIVDTGIDLTHPDLNVNTTQSRTFVTTYPDNQSPQDLKGHGTHVSGTIAAKNNTIGVVGIAAGAPVVAVKVLDQNGSGYTSTIVKGLDYVYSVGKAGDVVNLSLGGGVSSTLDNEVIKVGSKGIYVAIAAGNSAANANYTSPARANGLNVFTVSAHDSYGRLASFSNYGNPPIDYSAPGVSVYSTYKGGAYATMSGTSMATPHVAGILLAKHGAISFSGYITGDKDSTPDKKAHE